MIIGLILGLVVGAALGLVAGLLVRASHVAGSADRRGPPGGRARTEPEAGGRGRADLRSLLADQQQRLALTHAEAARLTAELDAERRAAEQRAVAFEETREQLTGEFARLSALALQQNNEQFLQLADAKLNETRQAAEGELAKRQEAIEQLLKPIGDQLGKYEAGMQRLEVERQRAYTSLTEQMKHLSTSHDQLHKETRNLVTALRSPQTRGRWGELQLRRVVEMAGHARALRLRGAGHLGRRQWPHASRHGGPPPRGQERGRRRQGADAGLPRRQRGRRRDRSAVPAWPVTAGR